MNLTGHLLETSKLGPLQLLQSISSASQTTIYNAAPFPASAQSPTYAVKHCHSTNPNDRMLASLRLEAELHFRASRAPHVNPLREALVGTQPEDGWFLVMEKCDSDLHDWLLLHRHQEFDELQRKKMFVQILTAFAWCHEMGIYHRDIKPENILVKDASCFVSDFGLAVADKLSWDVGAGSLAYMAPEIGFIRWPGVNPASLPESVFPTKALDTSKQDVWSLGQLAVNLFTHLNAWNYAHNSNAFFKFYMENPRQNLMKMLPITREFNEILVKVFEVDPAKRIGVKDLLKMVRECDKFVVSAQEFAARQQTMLSAQVAQVTHSDSNDKLGNRETNDSAVDVGKKGLRDTWWKRIRRI